MQTCYPGKTITNKGRAWRCTPRLSALLLSTLRSVKPLRKSGKLSLPCKASITTAYFPFIFHPVPYILARVVLSSLDNKLEDRGIPCLRLRSKGKVANVMPAMGADPRCLRLSFAVYFDWSHLEWRNPYEGQLLLEKGRATDCNKTDPQLYTEVPVYFLVQC